MTIRNPPSRPRFPTVPGATMIVAAVRDACVVEWSGRVADCRHGGGGCDDRLVPVSQVGEAIPARVTEVYDQMMRGVIGSAQRDLGFRGRLREFSTQRQPVRYGRLAEGRLGPPPPGPAVHRERDLLPGRGPDRRADAGARRGHLVGDRRRAALGAGGAGILPSAPPSCDRSARSWPVTRFLPAPHFGRTAPATASRRDARASGSTTKCLTPAGRPAPATAQRLATQLRHP
jgi:hypothetical protein